MSDCLFCKIAAKQLPANIIYEDEQLLAFEDIAPKAETHVLVIPKRHLVNLDDVQADDAELMGQMMLTISKIAGQLGLDGYRTITNTGAKGGQEVFHMHFHILAGSKLARF